MKRILSLVLTLLLAGLACASVVVTHVPDAIAQERDVEKAKEAFREGRDFYANEEYEKAAELFIEAHEYSGRSELYFNIGQAYRNAGDLVAAEEYFQLYLSEMPDAPNSEDVVNVIIEIQQQIAASMATVKVTTAPVETAQIFVDGDESARCTSPCEIQVDAGEHTVLARDERGREAAQTVRVEASQKLNLDLVFKSIGRLMLISNAPGALRVGDVVNTRLPLDEALELSPGTYSVSVTSSDATWNGDVEVVADETLQVMVPMDEIADAGGTSVLQAVSNGLWGLGGALVIGGAVMGMQAQDTFDNLEAQRANGLGIDPAIVEQGRSQQSTANTLYISGGVAIAAGVGLFVWDAMSDSASESAPQAVSEREVEAAEEAASSQQMSPEAEAQSDEGTEDEESEEEGEEEGDITLDLLE